MLLCLQRNKRHCGWYYQRATKGFNCECIQSLSHQTKAVLCRRQQSNSEQHRLLWTHITGVTRRNICCVWLCEHVSPSYWTLNQNYEKETVDTLNNSLNINFPSFTLVYVHIYHMWFVFLALNRMLLLFFFFSNSPNKPTMIFTLLLHLNLKFSVSLGIKNLSIAKYNFFVEKGKLSYENYFKKPD